MLPDWWLMNIRRIHYQKMDTNRKPALKPSEDWHPREVVGDILCLGDGTYSFSIHYDPNWESQAAFVEALRKHARCSACGAPPQADFRSCPRCDDGLCERPFYSVSVAVWDSELEALWKKDRRRVSDWFTRKSRREAIEASDEPSYSHADITLLRSVQNDACYYCGTSISENFQVDHLEPLASGGSNGIRNIMLACADCNRRKWALDEAQFWRKLRKRLPSAQFKRVRESAKVMKREVRRQLREFT